MKKILFIISFNLVLAYAQQYTIFDINGKNYGTFYNVLNKESLNQFIKKYHGSVLVKKENNTRITYLKNTSLNQISSALLSQVQKNIDLNQDSLNDEKWIEVEKNEIVKICLDKKSIAWETTLNAAILNESCLIIQVPTLIGVDTLNAYLPDSERIYKINLAVGMKFLNFENEQILLGFNTYKKDLLLSLGKKDNEDPERIVSVTGSYLVDRYPVTNCEFTQLMWDNISAASLYGNESLTKDYYNWLNRKRASTRNENCLTQDTAANTVSLFQAMKYANARSIREGLKPYYIFSQANDAEREKIISNKQHIISHRDFTIHKNKYVQVTADSTSNGYRLPYYNEWMMFARGGDKKNMAPWGDSSGSFEKTKKYARLKTKMDSFETEPVGQLTPNGYGLYDMFGLVQEHVLLEYDLFEGNLGFASCLKGGDYHVSLDEESFNETLCPYWKWINFGYYEPGHPGYGAGFRLIRKLK